MRTILFVVVTIAATAACKSGTANPADCTTKRDISACRNLCESGKTELRHFCYAERAFQMADCVDKNQGCDVACKEWTGREDLAKKGDTDTVDLFKATIGEKYNQMAAKCGGAAPAPGSATP